MLEPSLPHLTEDQNFRFGFRLHSCHKTCCCYFEIFLMSILFLDLFIKFDQLLLLTKKYSQKVLHSLFILEIEIFSRLYLVLLFLVFRRQGEKMFFQSVCFGEGFWLVRIEKIAWEKFIYPPDNFCRLRTMLSIQND